MIYFHDMLLMPTSPIKSRELLRINIVSCQLILYHLNICGTFLELKERLFGKLSFIKEGKTLNLR